MQVDLYGCGVQHLIEIKREWGNWKDKEMVFCRRNKEVNCCRRKEANKGRNGDGLIRRENENRS